MTTHNDDAVIIRTDDCPACGATFDVEDHEIHRVSRRRLAVTDIVGGEQWDESESTSWTVTCRAGHTYDVSLRANVSPCWALVDRKGQP